MMNKRLINYGSVLLLMLFGIISQSAMALSLGEITVRSHFAEPLFAEISLPSYSVEEMGSIEIHLASAAQHEAMGYELTDITKKFHFSVKENKKGVLYIEVRSKSAINALSISLLIEVSSVNGRSIKGYDILLTPKAISEDLRNKKNQQSKLKLRSTEIEKIISVGASENIITPTSPPERMPSKIKKLKDGGLQYTNVSNGDSLSKIAQRIRPHKSMHMNQVMIALYNENPGAFLNGNINKLKSGVSLNLHNIESIIDISESQAKNLIEQYAATPTKIGNSPQVTENNLNTEQATSQVELTANRLEISSSDEVLSTEIMEEIYQEQITNLESDLKNAHTTIQNLDTENKKLLERITSLELEINKITNARLSSPSQNETDFSDRTATASNTPENNSPKNNLSTSNPPNKMLVINTDVTKIEENDISVMATFKQNQLSLAFTGLVVLIVALILARKKEVILQAISNLKQSRSHKNNMFD